MNPLSGAGHTLPVGPIPTNGAAHAPKGDAASSSDTPVSAPNRTDPGDETQKKFRYQYAYGVILWALSFRKGGDYIALWCEQHEDFLGQVSERLFDGYQIKTRGDGQWQWNHEELISTVKRFVHLNDSYPGQMREFFFVSNANCSGSVAEDRIHLSPLPILTLLRFQIYGPFPEYCERCLNDLATRTECSRASVTRLLDRYGVSHPGEIVLEDIAWDLGVEVSTGNLTGAEAHLVRVGEVGTITVSNLLTDRGAQRFAIAHELGHWQMHRSRSQYFFCTDADMKEYRNSGPELEANTFAAELLMPRSMIDPKLLSSEPSWATIKFLSEQFEVAPITAALRYVDLARQPVMAVFSDRRNVKWWRENRSKMNDVWLESQQPLAPDSIAYHLEPDATGNCDLAQVPWDAWFPHCRCDEDEELFELAAVIDDRGTVMSLLWAPGR